MSYTTQVYNIAKTTRKNLMDIDKKISDLEAKQRDYSPNLYEETHRKLVEQRKEASDNGIRGFNSAFDAYKKATHEWFTLDGSSATDDMKLLDGKISIDHDALLEMFNKYKDNYTMQKAIADYGANHDTFCPLRSEDDEIIKARALRNFYDGSVSHLDLPDNTWDGWFNDISASFTDR